MGLFDKKYCDVCGEKIGLLGNRKLEDGNLCKECSRKLSPFFTERKHSTLSEIKEQLAYREANKEDVAAFRTTRSFGDGTRLLADEKAGRFLIARTRDLEKENPDVVPMDAVTGVRINVHTSKSEKKKDGPDGKKVSFVPARYDYDFRFEAVLDVNHPYFDTMTFPMHTSSIEVNDFIEKRIPMTEETIGRINPAYREMEKMGEEIRQLFMGDASAEAAPAEEKKAAVVCPFCGATTMPDDRGCCEYCGAPVGK